MKGDECLVWPDPGRSDSASCTRSISQFYVALIITELSVPTMAILKCYYMDNHLSTNIMLSQISIGIVLLKS